MDIPRLSSSKPRPATCTERVRAPRLAERGATLIELIIFVIVVALAIAGLLTVFNQSVRGSADPLVRKQALAIAESLLTEVLMRPFNFCDPQDPVNDPNAASPPTSSAGCTGGAGGPNDQSALGPRPPAETRYSTTNPFDNVGDYHGFAMNTGIYSLDDGTTPIAGLGAYRAEIAISQPTGAISGVPPTDVRRVDVTVRVRDEVITLTGYRFRYAPLLTG